MNKRLAALFTVLTLAFMLCVSAIARHGAANGVSSSGYPALSSAENTLCRVEHGAVQINVNAADEETLMLLDGVGEKLAARIVAYREAHGAFESVEELTNVEGLGAGKLNALRDEIYCGPAG